MHLITFAWSGKYGPGAGVVARESRSARFSMLGDRVTGRSETMPGQRLTPRKDPLFKHLHAPQRNAMLAGLMSQLRRGGWQGGGPMPWRGVRRRTDGRTGG